MFESSWVYTRLQNDFVNSVTFNIINKIYYLLIRTWVNSVTYAFVITIYNFFVNAFKGSLLTNLFIIGEPKISIYTEQSLFGRAFGIMYNKLHGITFLIGRKITRYYNNSKIIIFLQNNVTIGVVSYVVFIVLSYILAPSIMTLVPWLGIGVLIALYIRIELGILYLASFIPVNLALLEYEIIPQSFKYTVEITLAVMLLILFYKAFFTDRVRLQLSDLDVPIIIIFFVGFASAMFNGVELKIAIYGMRAFMQFALLYLIIAQMKPNRELIKKFLVYLILFATIIASIGIAQRILGITTPIQWVDATELNNVSMRAFSTMSNPNTFAGYLIIFIPIVFAFALAPIHPGIRLVTFIITGMMVTALLLTYSRGALLGLAAGLVMLGLIYDKRLLGLAAIGGFSLTIIAPSVVTRVLYGFSADYIAKSLNYGRLLFWNFAIQIVERHPWLGVGPGRFGGSVAHMYGSPAYREIGLPLDYDMWVDSQIFQTWAELGTIGLIVLLWIMFNYIKTAYTAYRVEEDVIIKTMIAGALASFVGFMIQSVVASVWEIHQIAAFSWLFVGLVTSIRIRQKNEENARCSQCP